MDDKIIRLANSLKDMFVSVIKTLKLKILNTSCYLHLMNGPSLLLPSN